METLAQLYFNYRDISLRQANYKKVVNKDYNIYTFAIVEYTVISYKGFKTKGLKVGYKGKILDTR